MALCLLPPDPRLATAKIAVKSAKILMFASCCDIVPTSDSSQRSPSVSLPTGVTGPERGNLGARGSGSGSVASPVMVITIDGFRMGRGEGGGGCLVGCWCKHYEPL